MKNYLRLILYSVLLLAGYKAGAQISVTYPLENCVFQRDQNNRAKVYVAGNFTEFLDVIEVRLSPVNSGWGQQSDWIAIAQNPGNGFYLGNLEWVGGWYRLDIRGRRGNDVVGTASVNKVGIGEVFLVAGQSNGQGHFDKGSVSASDERVIHVDYDGIFGPNAPLPYPNFSHLQSSDVIAPRGKSSWYWAPLGDALASRLNVPVLFYNVAWDGSGVKSWTQSINGIGYSAYVPDIPFEPYGMPYGNLRNVMRNYVAITGIRAILWIQGEADNEVGTSQSDYYNHLQTLINQTRSEFNRNLTWVVSRTSYTVTFGSASRILEAQNQIIQNLPNVFAGPNMDQIQIPRPDGYHLSGEGLISAAVAWNGVLNNDFFSRSVPHLSKPPINVHTSCDNNALTIHAEGGLREHRWSNGSGGSQITPGPGLYQVAAFDEEGNYRFSPRYRVPENLGTITPPTITSVGPAEVCYGGSLTLRSSNTQNPIWSTGQTGPEIQVSSPGNYTVSVQNVLGCRSTSNTFVVALKNKVLPNPPVITANSSPEFCDGEEVVLTSSTGANTIWSNGVNNSRNTTVRQSGEYTARTRDAEGCFSEPSNKVTVTVNPLPAKPVISTSGSTTFCSGGEVTLRSSHQEGNTWSNNATGQSVVIRQDGEYTVSVVDGKGCKNKSDAVKVTVHPLPATPVITASRPLSFCEGDYTTLVSNTQLIAVWSDGSNNKQIDVRSPGDYWLVVVDQNGCRSEPSNKLTVTVNPLPEKPVITARGSTTFCENEGVTLEGPSNVQGYSWSTGETQRSIFVNKPGQITLQTVSPVGCKSPLSDAITTQTKSIPAAPVISANGPTEICESQTVTLTARGTAPFIWNTEATTATIAASTAGTYTARTRGSNDCYSNPSNAITVTTRPTPPVPVLQRNGSFSLLVSNHTTGGTYRWVYEGQPMANEQDRLIRMIQPGEYSAQAFIRYSDALTCYSEFSPPVLFEITPDMASVNVFPNPSTGQRVWIETAHPVNNAIITVYTLQGIPLATYPFDRLEVPVEIDLPKGAAGTLIIHVIADNFRATQKLVASN